MSFEEKELMANKELRKQRFKKAIVYLIFLIVLLLIARGVLGAGIFEDNFENYNLNADLNGQGYWTGGNGIQVKSQQTFEGIKAIKLNGQNGQDLKTGDNTYSDYIALHFNIDQDFINNNHQVLIGLFHNGDPKNYWKIQGSGVWFDYSGAGYELLYTATPNIWNTLYIEWDSNIWKYKTSFNDLEGEWESGEGGGWAEGLNGLWIRDTWGTGNMWLDEIEHIQFEAESELIVWGKSPASETEIINLDEPIVISYSGMDWDYYQGLELVFYQENTEITSKALLFNEDDLDSEESFDIPVYPNLFLIGVNGKWCLKAIAFGSQLDIQGGMFLTGLGYVDYFTEDLVDPEYCLNFNVEGLPSAYTFTGPNDWYLANVDRFGAPTEFFTDVIGLISPIFQKVAEFGQRVQSIFSIDDAYSRGYGLGEVFPKIKGYTDKISEFFGGFPIINFFIAIILIMSAMFVIRIIIKFIPFMSN